MITTIPGDGCSLTVARPRVRIFAARSIIFNSRDGRPPVNVRILVCTARTWAKHPGVGDPRYGVFHVGPLAVAVRVELFD